MATLSLQEALQQYLKNSKFKTYVQALQIKEVWEKLMGKTVAKYTDKIEIVGSTLFIHTNVAPLKNELLYQKETIISRVNEAMGDKLIKEVIIK
ncbi:MAG TPA: DUF721 domain-containing protein [Ferruginibacter sp.]|nr:DUF721 domain-containing protein [Ferruginibacter sp.]